MFQKEYQETEQHIQRCDFSRAASCCENVIFSDSVVNDTYWCITRAWCLYRVGLIEDAQALFEDEWEIICSSIHALDDATFSRLYDFFWSIHAYEKLLSVCELRLAVAPTADLLRRCAVLYSRLTNYASAVDCYSKALSIQSSSSTAYNLGVSLLQLGRYEEGLSLYEHRFDVFEKSYLLRDSAFTVPRWPGDLSMPSKLLEGKGVIVWAEQGFGDVIQFSRYLRLLAERGAYTLLLLPAAYASLELLLKGLDGVDDVAVISSNKINLTRPYHYHLPLMSCMNHFGLQCHTVPAVIPYINTSTHCFSACSSLALSIKTQRLKQPKRYIGIVWSTAVNSIVNDKALLAQDIKYEKSISFDQLSALLAIEGVQFVNLKFPLSAQERRELNKYNVEDYSDKVSNFADTALLIESLDLIVSIDTAVAHLAGALGKPVINMLPYDSDWRWQMETDTTPWYPTMQLYRQKNRGNWTEVLVRVAEYIKSLA
ncbi:tetratricopeptide repeat-containing glycosyltransferase family protein [Eionea flava]